MDEKINSVEITDTNLEGRGIAKPKGEVIFIPSAAVGDVADITVTERRKNYAIARLDRLITPSPDRIEPDCAAFAEGCGGCTFRHITYEAELKLKQRAIVSAFRRSGIKIDLPEILSPGEDSRRNKAVLHCDGNRFGFYKEGTHTPIPLPACRCPSLPDSFAEVVAFAEGFFGKSDQKPTYLYLRRSSLSGKLAVTVGFAPECRGARTAAKAFADGLTSRFPEVSGVFRGSGNSPEDGRLHRLTGEDYLTESIADVSLRVSPSAFFQVNTEGAARLAELACEMLSPRSGETVADLYCGTGLFALTLAKARPDIRVIGIEINPSAVRNAEENAVLNSLGNAAFYEGDAKTVASRLDGKLDSAIIDPPRAGCSREMLAELDALPISRLVYISCNPSALARDAARLTESGWEMKAVKAVDMFARTGNVETICLLCRGG